MSGQAAIVSLPGRGRTVGFVLREPPSSNRYWRHIVIKNQARVLLSTEARQYRAEVAQEIARLGIAPLSGPISVMLTWDRARRSGDLDNRLKQLLDALKGLAFGDDADIVELHAARTDHGTGKVHVLLKTAGLGAA